MVLGKLMMIKIISIILVSAFAMSSLGYGQISVWAQESSNYPLPGMQNANLPPSGINPCFGQGNHTGTYHLQGNFTRMHHFGQRNFARMHHFGQGNFTRMHPCLSSTPNQSGSGSNIIPQGATITSSTTSTQTAPIPSWVKNNAKWWSTGTIDDSTFAQGIQYMVQQKIVKIPTTQSSQAITGVKIPQWVRNDAAYWSSNQIDDSTFIGAIQYLVQSGIVSP